MSSGPLTQLFQGPTLSGRRACSRMAPTRWAPLGALNRVYLNIGTFSEEWLLHFNALVGGKPVTPIAIATARRNSAYFAATENQTLDVARFFLRTTDPHRLKDAPGGAAYLTETPQQIAQGKNVFAETCARCHSSKAPTPPPTVLQSGPVRREDVPGLLERVLGVDRDGRVQGADARDRQRG